MLSRLCVRVQEEARALRGCPAQAIQDEVQQARELVKEAKNSRAVRWPYSRPTLPPPWPAPLPLPPHQILSTSLFILSCSLTEKASVKKLGCQ